MSRWVFLSLVGACVTLTRTPVGHSSAAAWDTRQAEPLSRNDDESDESDAPASYCGVYAMRRALSALGKDVSFNDMVRPEYIGARKGSSAEELIKLASDVGAHCQQIDHMTCRVLRAVQSPVVLHVKSDLGSSQYDHWILFMGVEDGNARIYDGAKPLRLVPFDELAALWDGVGLLVSNEPISRVALVLDLALPYTWASFLALMAVVVLRRVQSPFRTADRLPAWATAGLYCCGEATVILGVGLALVVGCYAFKSDGFLSYRPAIAAIQDAKLATFLSKVDVYEVARLQRNPHVVFIDARLAQDFVKGHLEGAINIPVNSTLDESRASMAKLRPGSRIIVYCQSTECPYSGIIAEKLARHGFRDVMLFEGGWLAWEQYQRHLDEHNKNGLAVTEK